METEPKRVAKRSTVPMEKEDEVGSYNYFEIPITKEAPTIPYVSYDGTDILRKPSKDASSVALSNSNRYENFINMAQHK